MLPELDFAHDALLLDIDGTLIEIAPTPEAVVVPDSLKRSLTALQPLFGGALAFCSGRVLEAVDHLFTPLKLAAIGAHGAEIRYSPDAPFVAVAPPISDAVKQAFTDVEARMPGVRVEDKTYTLAFHYRLAPQYESEVLATIAARLPKLDPGLVTLRGKAIVEIKSGSFNKGTGLRALMARPPFMGRRPVFLGDDRTDEDVLAVLAEYKGLGISVGTLLKGASAEIPSPAAVRDWLSAMASEEASR
ncbi:MAG TPA: trehalose-phosphatase [Rhizomicrobium sp.]|jgi:trehalose 6-phosphate phosphatase